MRLFDLLRRSGPRCAPNPSRPQARCSVEQLESRLSPSDITGSAPAITPAPAGTPVISQPAATRPSSQQSVTGWDVYPPSPGTPAPPPGQAIPPGNNTAGQPPYTAASMDSGGAAPGSFWEAYAPPPAQAVAAPPQALVVQTAAPPAH
jgi:hypothetical protein